MYHSKSVVTRTSERVCPIHSDVSGQIWCLQIWIERNIFIISDIYITSETSVTLSFSFIFVQAQHPVPRKCVRKKLFIDYFSLHNSARSKIGFYKIVEHPDS